MLSTADSKLHSLTTGVLLLPVSLAKIPLTGLATNQAD